MTALESQQYFLILNIILSHRNYTTISIYSDQSNSEVICEYFMEKYEFQPKSFFVLNNLNLNLEQHYFRDTLHLIFISNSLDEVVLDHLSIEDNIVVISDNDNVDPTIFLKKATHFEKKILFLTNLNLSVLKPSENRYVLESLTSNSNESIISNFVQNSFSYQFSQNNMTFFRQKGAHSFINFFDNKLMFFGPDGFIAEQIGQLLNRTVNCNTDFDIEYPYLKNFFTHGGYPYPYFYKELITTNVISTMNRRLVCLGLLSNV